MISSIISLALFNYRKKQIYMADEGLKPWCANPFHPSFKAARQAIGWTYSQIPDMIREGGSVDKLMSFQV